MLKIRKNELFQERMPRKKNTINTLNIKRFSTHINKKVRHLNKIYKIIKINESSNDKFLKINMIHEISNNNIKNKR